MKTQSSDLQKSLIKLNEKIQSYQSRYFINQMPDLELKRAEKLIEKNEFVEAEILLEKKLIQKRDPHTLYLLGKIKLQRFSFDQALNYFLESITLDSKNKDSLYHASLALLKMGNLDKATFFLDRLLQLEPNHLNALKQKMQIHYDKKDYAKATEFAASILKQDENCYRCYRYMGFCQLHLGNFDKAEKLFNMAIEKNPAWQDTLQESRALLTQNKSIGNQKSLQELEEQFDRKKDHRSLGFLYFYQGKHSKAEKEFQLAIDEIAN